MSSLVSVAPARATVASTRWTVAARRFARWLLLPSFVFLPVWAMMFQAEFAQVALFALALLSGLVAVAIGGLAIAVELFATKWRWPDPRAWRGRWAALLAPILWWLVLYAQLDARLWQWWNEAELQRVVASARSTIEPAENPTAHLGRMVRVVGTSRAVLIHFLGFAHFYGVAFDPDRELHTGWCAGMDLVAVRDLRGPWRYWNEAD